MIHFANPSALWLLTLLIPLIALYLLKHKRREVIVSTTLLWRKALEDSRAQTPFQKLRSSLLLFLQMLIVVMLTAILSQPSLPAGFHKKERWILVLDTSASMKATDEKPSRFDVARDLLLRTLDSLSGSDEMMLISFAQDVNVLHSFTNKSTVRSRINELEPQDLASNWKSLSDILQPLRKENRNAKIVIASDFANAPDSVLRGLDYQPLTVGKDGYNIGITRVAVRSLPDNPSNQNLFYQIKNFDKAAHNFDVEITSGARVIDAFTASLAPQQSLDRNMEWVVEGLANTTVRLKQRDSFALDNDFVFTAQPSEKIQVALKMDNVFLKKALAALPQVAISASAKIVITDRMDQDVSGIFFVPGAASQEAEEPIEWNAAHPSLRYVDAGLWRLGRSGNLTVPPGADILIETSREPVAYAEDRAGRRRIVVGCSLNQSNLVMMASFPIFLYNSLEWIHAGLQKPLFVTTSSEIPKEGAIQIEGRQLQTNFLDPVESDIQPNKPVVQSAGQAFSAIERRDISQWFLLILLGLVILEWWAFHRRVSVEG